MARPAEAEEICAAVTFDEILDSFGLPPLKNGRGLCPVCRGTTNKSAFHAEDAKGIYYCHRGTHGGDKANLVCELQGCSRREALEYLAALSGLTYGLSREEWRKWKAIRDRQQAMMLWLSRMIAALKDLQRGYRQDERRFRRVGRWIAALEALSGNEILGWFESRHLLAREDATDERQIVEAQRIARAEFHKAALADAQVQLRLLAAEASPEEWTAAMRAYRDECQGSKSKKRRDTGAVGSGAGTWEHHIEPPARTADRIAVPA